MTSTAFKIPTDKVFKMPMAYVIYLLENKTSEEVLEIESSHIYECYVEDCEDRSLKPCFSLFEVEDVLDQIKLEIQQESECPKCFGGGCNYCLMVSY